MSFLSFLESFAQNAMTDIAPALQIEQTLSPIVAMIPGAAPIVAGINTGIASIEAVAPGVAAATGNLITDAAAALRAAGPAEAALDSFVYGVFHVHIIPGVGVLLAPQTSSATVPAGIVTPAPGTALS